ncbi:MAG: CotH kinase family protein [Oscillospiraceae bacterium]|nr:CotH kinase family protein [Oscillospiraceae bacterium]
MKQRLLSVAVLFAMLVSVFISDNSLCLRTKVSADENEKPEPLVISIFENGNEIDFRYHQWIRSKDPNAEITFEGPEGAAIYYTTSAQNKSGIFTNTATSGDGRIKARFEAPALLDRHNGGGSPINAARTGPSSNALTYNGTPVKVELPNSRYCTFTLSVITVKDGEASDPVTMTWIRISDTVRQPMLDNNYLIFNLYTDPVGLYGFEDGIMIGGKQRFEWARVYAGPCPACARAAEANPLYKPPPGHLTDGSPPFWGDNETTGHLDQACFPPTTVANYFMRGRGAERAMFVEAFDAHGSRLLAQTAGARIKGGWSRGTYVNDQKTFELYARNSYNEYDQGGKNTFMFPLFGNVNSIDQTGNIQHRFRRFRLRNGGSDRERAYVRDELSATLWRQSGFENTQHHRPAVVFLNGAYYGLSWVKSPRTENAWAALYGGQEDQFHALGSSEEGRSGCARNGCDRVMLGQANASTSAPLRCNGSSRKCAATEAADNPNRYANRLEECLDMQSTPDEICGGDASTSCSAVADWNHVRDIIRGGRLDANLQKTHEQGREQPDGLEPGKKFSVQLDANGRPCKLTRQPVAKTEQWEAFDYFCALVDIDNMVQYFATQMYVGNCDWPTNNMEMYRYYPTTEELDNPNLHPVLDGKWRMGAFDLEFGYGLWGHNQKNDGTPTGTLPGFNTIQAMLNRRSVPTGGEGYGIGHFGANPRAYTFTALARREDMRVKFANAFYDLMEGAFEATNAVKVFNKLAGAIENEHKMMLSGTADGGAGNGALREKGSFRRIDELGRGGLNTFGQQYWPLWPSNPDDSNIADDHKYIRDNLTNRATNMRGFIGTAYSPACVPSAANGLGCADSARNLNINLTVGDGGHVKLNNRYFGMNAPEISPPKVLDKSDPYKGIVDPDPVVDPRIKKNVNAKYFANANAPIPIVVTPWPGYVTVWPNIPELYVDPAQPNNPNRRLISAAGTYAMNITFAKCTGCMQNNSFSDCKVCGAGSSNGGNGTKVPGNIDITKVRTSIEPGRGESWTGNRQSDRCTGFIAITNNSQKSFSTRGAFLSCRDGANPKTENLLNIQLPSLIIKPGDSIYLPARHNGYKQAGMWNDVNVYELEDSVSGGYFKKRSRMDFNIDFGNRLRIVDASGKLQTMIDVTNMSGTQKMVRQKDGTFKLEGVPMDGVPPAICKTCGNITPECTCDCPGGCGFPIPQCRCSPFMFVGGSVTLKNPAVITQSGQYWDGSKQNPIWQVVATFEANTDLVDWRIITQFSGGVTQGQNFTRFVVNGPWGQNPSTDWGAQASVTGGRFEGWGINQGNQNTFNFIPEGTTFTITMRVGDGGENEPPSLSYPG